MLSEVPKEFKRYLKHCQGLRRILKDTNSSLNDINSLMLWEPDIKQEVSVFEALQTLAYKVQRVPNLIIFGQSCHAKALFINLLLQQKVLPYFSNQWRHITFKYGPAKNIHLTLGHEIEIVENLKAHEESSWVTIPEEDLKRGDNENVLDHCPSVEVILKHSLLKENVKIVVPPDCPSDQLVEVLGKIVENVLPVIIYAVSDDSLSDSNIQEIKKLKDIFSVPFLFVSLSSVGSRPNEAAISALSTESLTESEKHLVESFSQKKLPKITWS